MKSWVTFTVVSFLSFPCYAKGTGIHESARQGDLAQVEAYLAHDPSSISLRDGAERTPLAVAAIGGHKEVVVFLVSHGADVNDKGFMDMTPLADMASGWGQEDDDKCTEIAKVLLLHGAHIDAIDGYGETPLCWAARSGKIRLVQFLLEKGANISFNHNAPVRVATREGQVEVVKILLKAGAHLEAKDSQP